MYIKSLKKCIFDLNRSEFSVKINPCGGLYEYRKRKIYA